MDEHPGRRALRLLGDHLEEDCPDCNRYCRAVESGRFPRAVLHLRCERAQEWQMEVEAMTAGQPDEGEDYGC